jgi:hypothetical protein
MAAYNVCSNSMEAVPYHDPCHLFLVDTNESCVVAIACVSKIEHGLLTVGSRHVESGVCTLRT